MDEHLWHRSLALFRGLSHLKGATATADLLELAQPNWECEVVARTSMHDLLFTLPGEEHPWDKTVRVGRVGKDAFEFQFVRGGHLISADRATDSTALAVLDAFLMQLTGT